MEGWCIDNTTLVVDINDRVGDIGRQRVEWGDNNLPKLWTITVGHVMAGRGKFRVQQACGLLHRVRLHFTS